MKISHLLSYTVAVGVLGMSLAGTALAGQPNTGAGAARPAAAGAAAPAQAGPVVVAIDLTKILKEHRGFKAKMDQLGVDLKAAEEKLNNERKQIAALDESMAKPTSTSPKPGTADYKKLEEQLIHMKAEFNSKAAVTKKDFMDRETKIYYDTYTEISSTVESFANYYKISMVLRYNSSMPNISEVNAAPGREEVAVLMQKPIVFLGQNLDITTTILNEINKKYPAPPETATKGGAPIR